MLKLDAFHFSHGVRVVNGETVELSQHGQGFVGGFHGKETWGFVGAEHAYEEHGCWEGLKRERDDVFCFAFDVDGTAVINPELKLFRE